MTLRLWISKCVGRNQSTTKRSKDLALDGFTDEITSKNNNSKEETVPDESLASNKNIVVVVSLKSPSVEHRPLTMSNV